jgi:dTDP-4-dehydrorhamnose 3,5-epimerase
MSRSSNCETPVLEITPTAIPDVLILKPRRFADTRGFFVETWNARRMAQNGLDLTFVQDNMSLSRDVGTVRGLHYQSPPHGQGKLVGCPAGAIFDVAVDVRVGSPTYGQWVGADLTAENGCLLWIPEGFLHGFVTRAPDTLVAYKCTGFYEPAADGGVRWDTAGIDWALTAEPGLSDKDAKAPALADWTSPFTYEAAQ